MKSLHKQQSGFFLMIAALVVVLFGGIAFVGMRVYNREQAEKKARLEAQCQEEAKRPYNGVSAECAKLNDQYN